MRIEPEKSGLITNLVDQNVLNISRATTVEAGGLTITAGGLTVTAGDVTVTAGSIVQTVPQAVIADPGDGVAITAASGAVKNQCSVVTAGAETRLLGTPEFVGQELSVIFLTDGGDLTIDNTAGFNDDTTSSNLATFNTAGECLHLIAVGVVDGDDWRHVGKKGVVLS